MPIYEYQCQDCGHQFEILQRISEDPPRDCPQCEHPALKKLVSKVGFKLKGTGWYETDFKNKPAAKSGGGAEDKGKGAGDGAEGAAEKGAGKPSEAGSGSDSGKAGDGKPAASSAPKGGQPGAD